MRLQSERFLTKLVEPGADPQYPAYTGSEPCSTIGNDFYCDDLTHEYDEILFKACNGCPLLKDCFNWALHNERFYYWGASTAADRHKIRKQFNIKIHERWSQSA
jgi:hypothetical protein